MVLSELKLSQRIMSSGSYKRPDLGNSSGRQSKARSTSNPSNPQPCAPGNMSSNIAIVENMEAMWKPGAVEPESSTWSPRASSSSLCDLLFEQLSGPVCRWSAMPASTKFVGIECPKPIFSLNALNGRSHSYHARRGQPPRRPAVNLQAAGHLAVLQARRI